MCDYEIMKNNQINGFFNETDKDCNNENEIEEFIYVKHEYTQTDLDGLEVSTFKGVKLQPDDDNEVDELATESIHFKKGYLLKPRSRKIKRKYETEVIINNQDDIDEKKDSDKHAKFENEIIKITKVKNTDSRKIETKRTKIITRSTKFQTNNDDNEKLIHNNSEDPLKSIQTNEKKEIHSRKQELLEDSKKNEDLIVGYLKTRAAKNQLKTNSKEDILEEIQTTVLSTNAQPTLRMTRARNRNMIN